jgi:hypothetical protein
MRASAVAFIAGLDMAVLAALPVTMAFAARGMVPKSHALPGHNRSQALKRHGQGNHNRKQANEP